MFFLSFMHVDSSLCMKLHVVGKYIMLENITSTNLIRLQFVKFSFQRDFDVGDDGVSRDA